MLALGEVKSILRDGDIEGYIQIHGAPEDEYDTEAKNIFSAIQSIEPETLTEEGLLEIICQEWERSFELDDADMSKRLPYLRQVAAALIAAHKSAQ